MTIPFTPTEFDAETMARTIFGESRDQPLLGRAAVGWVIRNRVVDPRWPNTVAGVCLQPLAEPYRHMFQFSPWNQKDSNRLVILAATRANPLFLECYAIAWGVIAGTIRDPVKGANHFFNPKIANPSWHRAEAVTATIGGHVFERL